MSCNTIGMNAASLSETPRVCSGWWWFDGDIPVPPSRGSQSERDDQYDHSQRWERREIGTRTRTLDSDLHSRVRVYARVSILKAKGRLRFGFLWRFISNLEALPFLFESPLPSVRRMGRMRFMIHLEDQRQAPGYNMV